MKRTPQNRTTEFYPESISFLGVLSLPIYLLPFHILEIFLYQLIRIYLLHSSTQPCGPGQEYSPWGTLGMWLSR